MTEQEAPKVAIVAEQPLEFDDPVADKPTPEEVAAEEQKEKEAEQEIKRLVTLPEPTNGGAPGWVKSPAGMRFPKGRMIIFVRFRAEWTSTPKKGHEIEGETGLWRQAICWDMSIGDQKLGLQRSVGDPNRQVDEFAKQMVRAIDGAVIDWSGAPGAGAIDVWWEEIGPRCRSSMHRIFGQLHTLSKEQMAYFFESCIAVRNAG